MKKVLKPTPIEAPNNALLIEDLEYLLEKAKAGELLGYAVACFYKGNHYANGWAGNAPIPFLIGSIEALKVQLIQKYMDD